MVSRPMARRKKAIPDFRCHVSGQAIVTRDSRDFYLDSPESRAKHMEPVKQAVG